MDQNEEDQRFLVDRPPPTDCRPWLVTWWCVSLYLVAGLAAGIAIASSVSIAIFESHRTTLAVQTAATFDPDRHVETYTLSLAVSPMDTQCVVDVTYVDDEAPEHVPVTLYDGSHKASFEARCAGSYDVHIACAEVRREVRLLATLGLATLMRPDGTIDVHGHELYVTFLRLRPEIQVPTTSRCDVMRRMDILIAARPIVDRLNTESTGAATFALSHMSALSPSEYGDLLGLLLPSGFSQGVPAATPAGLIDNSPPAIDWSTKDDGKYLTPVKNQQQCGDCYAYATVETFESMLAIAADATASRLSVRQPAACTYTEEQITGDSLKGRCKGGWPSDVVTSIFKRGSAFAWTSAEPSAPSTSGDWSCSTAAAFNSEAYSWASAPSTQSQTWYNIEDIKAALQKGPLISTIYAASSAFKQYSSGILDVADCPSNNPDHAVQLVGWGTSGSTEYWLVRNSWGTGWGEKGFVRLSISDHACGLAPNGAIEIGVVTQPSLNSVCDYSTLGSEPNCQLQVPPDGKAYCSFEASTETDGSCATAAYDKCCSQDSSSSSSSSQGCKAVCEAVGRYATAQRCWKKQCINPSDVITCACAPKGRV